mgnify:CR=1 FL=1
MRCELNHEPLCASLVSISTNHTYDRPPSGGSRSRRCTAPAVGVWAAALGRMWARWRRGEATGTASASPQPGEREHGLVFGRMETSRAPVVKSCAHMCECVCTCVRASKKAKRRSVPARKQAFACRSSCTVSITPYAMCPHAPTPLTLMPHCAAPRWWRWRAACRWATWRDWWRRAR